MSDDRRACAPGRDASDASDALHLLAEKPGEECAVFGIYAPGEDTARLTYFGLQALQHRGQESAGIAVGDGTSVVAYKDRGLVVQVFNESVLSPLDGFMAIGHTRYSTSAGSGTWDNAQPHFSNIGDSIIALAHNGNLLNTNAMRSKLIELGISFRSSTDSEVASRFIAHYTQKTQHMRKGIRQTMEEMKGAYAMVLITSQALYAFRDPSGFRPLSLGRLPDDKGWVVSSETCGLDIVGAEFVRDIAPGEVIRINADGLTSEQAVPAKPRAFCIFELVYIARPDSVLDGRSVFEARRDLGAALAKEAPVEADFVIGVPDSGVPAAIGYALESGIPYMEGIVKNRYVGRTFIQPTQALRERGVRLKLNPLTSVIKGKRLILVDDSIVRGNTSRQLVGMLLEAGAAEVHVRVVSPPVVWPCFFGVDTESQQQLIASQHDIEGIRSHIGADSLAYISHQAMCEACATDQPGFCTACFSGEYPLNPQEQIKAGFFCEGRTPEVWESERDATLSLFDDLGMPVQ
jgi:amidophosphoribosyltransferase